MVRVMETWHVAVALLLVVLALGGALWWHVRRRRREARRKRPAQLRHPVVLAHGLLGFDELRLGQMRQEYFRGVPERLRIGGASVHVLKVHPFAGVAQRAEELARYIRSLDAKHVNIIAHSMGGLDARYALAHLDVGKRVRSLTTIGTPHRGTPLANLGSQLLTGALVVRPIIEKLGLQVDALDQLTTQKMAEFNRTVPDVKGVAYGCVVGAMESPSLEMNPLLVPSFMFIARQAGPNDGLVPAESQSWGEVLTRIQADHWAQIGWSLKFDAPEFYNGLVTDLRGRGF